MKALNSNPRKVIHAFLILYFILTWADAGDQSVFSPEYFDAMEYRCIGPYRGGRSAAVAGVPGDPMTYYFGATGGGVWKTSNGGQTWHNISDGFFGGSIGAVAVSEWDPNVIYVGGGEKTVRGNVSHGYGMWKSEDAGKTWRFIGLEDSRHIPRIRIHPQNPDLVYAAVLGHLFGPNQQHGIFRSKDGGNTWQNILFVDQHTGAIDLVMDPTNPRILFASFWQVKRTPYSLESGGPGSGLWKSTDGGDTWKNISGNEGLPGGIWGITGVAVSAADPNRIYAIIEANDGGVYRSDDGGDKWKKVNDERKLRQRAWYYTRIYTDPLNKDIVYVPNVQFWISRDGGKTYESIATPHGDHHDLWINPHNPQQMIVADDGGAQVSLNGGESWSTYHNQPTAQFYRVTTDNHFPYRIYGGQQDNSTVRIMHRSDTQTIDERHWEATAGGESGWLAPHPQNPDIVFGGSYGGYLQRLNHKTREVRLVDVWPDNPMGHGAKDLRYRFQWNFPILFSRHEANTLYAAGNVLFKTTNEGQSWQPISPDLTRNDSTKMGPSGGPITKDNTSVEYYCTIFALAESAHEPGVIWAGSDDGLIHLTRDGGKTWQNVTPPKNIMPEWIQINSIETHPFEAGGLYVAATMYKWDDFRPYLYKTTDYGKTWQKITTGIDKSHFTRVIRADPNRRGLLYAGTESGMYVSFNDGKNWQSLQLNLPVVPITDLAIKDNDLIVATQGRSFWVLDDLTTLQQLNAELSSRSFWLFEPRPTYRWRGGQFKGSLTAGTNPAAGVLFRYYFKEAPDSSSVKLKILEENGSLIRSFDPQAKAPAERLAIARGSNQFVWNMRYPDAEKFDNLILWAGGLQGPLAVPGTYQARLIVGGDSLSVPFQILPDPRSQSTLKELQAQFDFLMEIRDKLTEIHQTIREIRDVRTQIKTLKTRLGKEHDSEKINREADNLIRQLTTIEEALYQTKNQSAQDPLNYPIRLNNRLSSLASSVGYGDFAPTEQARLLKKELVEEINKILNEYRAITGEELALFNQMVYDSKVPAVLLKNLTP